MVRCLRSHSLLQATTLRRGDRAVLEQWVRARRAPRWVLERARIVMASGDGDWGEAIGSRLGVSRSTVSRWPDRHDRIGHLRLRSANSAWRMRAPKDDGGRFDFTPTVPIYAQSTYTTIQSPSRTASVHTIFVEVKTANETLASLH